MILSLLVVSGTLVFLAWLVFALAAYALPCFVAVSAGMLAQSLGAGGMSAIVIGFSAGVLTVVLARTALAYSRSPLMRLPILAVFIAPAGVAGFGIAHDVAQMTSASAAWGIVAGTIGAIATMLAALARLLGDPDGAVPTGRAGPRPMAAYRP